MVTFIFNNVIELEKWRVEYINKFNEFPRITASIINGETEYKATVNL